MTKKIFYQTKTIENKISSLETENLVLKLNLVLVALNIAQEHLKKMDKTYEDKPNKPEEINKVDNNAEVLECKVCEKKF